MPQVPTVSEFTERLINLYVEWGVEVVVKQ